MLSDFEDLNFENLDDAKTALKKLLGEASAIKANSDRTLEQRKHDKTSFATELEELKTSVSALTAKNEELENKGMFTEGNFDELFDKKTEKLRLNHKDELAEKTKALEMSESNYNSLQHRYNSERINSALRKAAEKAGVEPLAIDDAINRATGVFSVSTDGVIEARDKDGNLKTVKNKQLSPDLFVASLRETAPHLWPPSKSAGAGGGNGQFGKQANPFDKKAGTFNLTEQAKLRQVDPELADQMKAAAG